ncbi:hypothetical protein Y1Q_0012230 [Alligator mississippiensis]|uniref:Uncharacterized protein n=1 Tax=Alligator mississippiensis TaxID=8496 RepID=A0A151NUY9_ALLMI|nr:hypothetical protein Y1Q_0012230 [Alligator mississippiensis]
MNCYCAKLSQEAEKETDCLCRLFGASRGRVDSSSGSGMVTSSSHFFGSLNPVVANLFCSEDQHWSGTGHTELAASLLGLP